MFLDKASSLKLFGTNTDEYQCGIIDQTKRKKMRSDSLTCKFVHYFKCINTWHRAMNRTTLKMLEKGKILKSNFNK